jgi:hypothetical protein
MAGIMRLGTWKKRTRPLGHTNDHILLGLQFPYAAPPGFSADIGFAHFDDAR